MRLLKIRTDFGVNFINNLKKKIELQFPEQTSACQIIADGFMLIRFIQNIVQNLLRYSNSKAVISYRHEGRKH